MTRFRPSSILLLLLALCVLDAGFTSFAGYKSPAATFEVEEGLQEGMDDLQEEEGSFGTDISDVVFCTWDVVLPSELALRLTDGCRHFLSLYSFGWVLPLRI